MRTREKSKLKKHNNLSTLPFYGGLGIGHKKVDCWTKYVSITNFSTIPHRIANEREGREYLGNDFQGHQWHHLTTISSPHILECGP